MVRMLVGGTQAGCSVLPYPWMASTEIGRMRRQWWPLAEALINEVSSSNDNGSTSRESALTEPRWRS